MAFNLFRWRSRVKTGNPEVAGNSVETLASHVSDTNAHPDYLKKGEAVPTGQEAFAIAQHASSKVAHASTNFRRDEGLKTVSQFRAARAADYNDVPNNYYSNQPTRHIVTAYVLGLILDGYVDLDMFKNVVKRHYDINGRLGPVGDGSQLIYIENNADGFGYAVLSTKTIGSPTKPVYLKNGTVTVSSETVGSGIQPVYLNAGTITKSTSNVGTTLKPVYVNGGVITEVPYECVFAGGNIAQTITGLKTYTVIPKISNANTMPSADVDFVTVAYLKRYAQIPVGGIYTHSFKTARTASAAPVEYTAAEIATLVGYGTWKVHMYIGDYACMYVRTA